MTENKKDAKQGNTDCEKKENIFSTTIISEEIPEVTAEQNVEEIQHIQNIPAETGLHIENNVQVIKRSRAKLNVNDIIKYKLKKSNDR